jgi:hypothetical protein
MWQRVCNFGAGEHREGALLLKSVTVTELQQMGRTHLHPKSCSPAKSFPTLASPISTSHFMLVRRLGLTA